MVGSTVGDQRLNSAGTPSVRERWFSLRAMLLHLAVAVIAPGCAVAGWWQVNRALSGNGLSWAYSVEWPAFALIAVVGWWHLIHEDPEAYAARRSGPAGGDDDHVGEEPGAYLAGRGTEQVATVDPVCARVATTLAILIGFEIALGVVTLFSVPLSRPSGWVPGGSGRAIFLVHSVFGVVVTVGAVALVVRATAADRTLRIVAWIGLVGVGLAGVGGLLTEDQSLMRFLGMALMLFGPALACFGYMAPTILNASRNRPGQL